MNKEQLPSAFTNSIGESTEIVVENIVEIGLDKLIDNTFIKEIPFLSTAAAVYNIGKNVSEIHHIKQLARFINGINNDVAEKREEFIRKFEAKNFKERKKELEYIILLCSMYLDAKKPKYLSKLYIKYVDGKIDWDSFVSYSEIINRLLPGDIDDLIMGDHKDIEDERVPDSLLRMTSLGLFRGINSYRENEKNYILTSFGSKLRNCLELDTREQQMELLNRNIKKLAKRVNDKRV